jgi:hypothetical protein
MNIDAHSDLSAVNEWFNRFHDGLIKQLVVSTDNQFLADMPWEEKRKFDSNEDELQNTGLCIFDDHLRLDLEIHHYNYDCSNQPRRRNILIRAAPTSFLERIAMFVGSEIFDLSFDNTDDQVSCNLVYHTQDVGPVRSLENGTSVTLFVAERVHIRETEWTELGDTPKPPNDTF